MGLTMCNPRYCGVTVGLLCIDRSIGVAFSSGEYYMTRAVEVWTERTREFTLTLVDLAQWYLEGQFGAAWTTFNMRSPVRPQRIWRVFPIRPCLVLFISALS